MLIAALFVAGVFTGAVFNVYALLLTCLAFFGIGCLGFANFGFGDYWTSLAAGVLMLQFGYGAALTLAPETF